MNERRKIDIYGLARNYKLPHKKLACSQCQTHAVHTCRLSQDTTTTDIASNVHNYVIFLHTDTYRVPVTTSALVNHVTVLKTKEEGVLMMSSCLVSSDVR